MRHLCKLFYVVCILFFSSCEETYNDKLFWPGEISQEYGSYITPYTLDLTYSGEKLTGKTVSFKTEDSETGTLTLKGIIPGEETTPISRVQLYENEEKGCYTFSGKNITMGGATVEYSGSIMPKAMKLDLNVTMASAAELAHAYNFGTYSQLPGDEFQAMIFTGACHFRVIPQEGVGMNDAFMMYMLSIFGSNILQIAIPQLIQDIKLESDGRVNASFSSDPIDTEQLLTLGLNGTSATEIQGIVKKRTYQPIPNGLAYWNKINNKFILQLNIPAIMNEAIKNSDQPIDSGLIQGISEAILKSDPIRLKSLLGVLNVVIKNDILGYLVKADDQSFTSIFSYIKEGIPLNVTHTDEGHTYLLLDYEALTPLINVIADSGIKIDIMVTQIDVATLAKEWKLMKTVDLGLDLVPMK